MCVFNSKYPLFERYLHLFGTLFANIIINFEIRHRHRRKETFPSHKRSPNTCLRHRGRVHIF